MKSPARKHRKDIKIFIFMYIGCNQCKTREFLPKHKNNYILGSFFMWYPSSCNTSSKLFTLCVHNIWHKIVIYLFKPHTLLSKFMITKNEISINNTVSKANRVLSFLRRNLDHCSILEDEWGYPYFNYGSLIWSPHTASNIQAIEPVHLRAARF